jgi:hypothetical protein
MAAELIAFPRQWSIPTAAIEDEIERLIAILDERQAACEHLEPDPDLEEAGDAETVAWPDWRPAKVVSIGPHPTSASGRGRYKGDSSKQGK